ncbi:Glycine-tRNA ligase chloroplastic mitochondrial [Micractinium conductrix]|uniref:glycine--tRNA ligase n=1 Tax=Micractinium conductrix TaxID=554055 RepID=A0A2P6VE86_9CHLO|nr:Glycine-tRNA ligase chloroplastic mitochondrial [Micractinium conductrix]|eukprot:PSC72381.1 Glycine-tRNA ligase chloroplastic mitochondrial [Micractinium conductrix]
MQTLRSSSLALARRALGAQLPLHRLTAGTCKALRSSSAVCQLPGAGRAGAGRGEAFSTQGSRSLATASRALPRAAAVEAPSAGAAAQQASNGGGSAAAGVPTFQEAIARLQTYWASVGCAMWLPHNTEVGAGTMNPATFLRVLGPEPWNVAYAEPSIRPDDSRYGDNPNRVQRHTQFQVILKPDPGNPQELYLGSLEALGIDTRAHDVRFVEDNWESPVLGAWGLGWEVWLDGMEVTQFTYFQQAGGKVLEVPSVEITYGLERILMSLQGAKHFKDIQYAPGVTYGEMFLQNEYEMSVYNLDEADVEGQRKRFELYNEEARRMLAKRLPVPAYDHLLKLSHTFNLLDARGAVGVTERANCFATMRSLAREITGLWLARREEQGYPLGLVQPAVEPPAAAVAGPHSAEPASFVLEIGSEELPPDDVVAAMEQLRDRVPALLDRLRLGHGGVTVEGTPRRLAVMVHELAARQSNSAENVRGPPAKVAYAATGEASPALLGFCKKNGVTVEDCFNEADAKGVEYVWAEVKQVGRCAAEVLTDELPALVGGLSFKKSMRWRPDAAFSRPLRWLLALHGDTVLPFSYAGLQAGATTRLLRNADAPEQQVPSADAYLAVLQHGHISLGLVARKQAIWGHVTAAAAGVGGVVPDSARGGLLEEVSNLVESPTVVLGGFDPAFLALPREVLVMVMRKHQRYFPVYKHQSDELLPYFITVANGAVDLPTVQAGNEAVLRARFEDAQFFYSNDLTTPLRDARPRLAGTVFQKDLGSLLDKSSRVEALVPALGDAAGLGDAVPVAAQAGHLCKADLATSMVTEMTALAGTMGRHYALKEGLPPAVAEAIFESVLPRNAGDLLPQTPAGLLVSVADKLDSLVGLFAAKCAPTATADPYGLRRAAVGLLQALMGSDARLDLGAAVEATAAVQPIGVPAEAKAAVLEFIERRLEQLLVDTGVQVEAVRAALKERGRDAALAARTAREIADEMASGEAGRLYQVMAAMARPVRLTRGKQIDAAWSLDESLLQQDEERALVAAFKAAAAQITPGMSVPAFLAAAEPLIAPLDSYFDKVFVMCEDEAVRRNRLALLRDLAALPAGILDLAELPGF